MRFEMKRSYRDDLRLLAYLGESHQEIEHLREKVPNLLGDT